MQVNKIQNFNQNRISFQKNKQLIKNPIVQKNILMPVIALMSMVSLNTYADRKEINNDVIIKNIPTMAKDDSVRYMKKFKLNNEDYTMVFVNDGKIAKDRQAVSDIYFIPANNKKPTLKVEHIVHNNLGHTEDENFVTAIVTVKDENKNSAPRPPQEIKLPNEIGEKILDLYQGHLEFYAIPTANTYSEYNCE